jgi:hypothetical protein
MSGALVDPSAWRRVVYGIRRLESQRRPLFRERRRRRVPLGGSSSTEIVTDGCECNTQLNIAGEPLDGDPTVCCTSHKRWRISLGPVLGNKILYHLGGDVWSTWNDDPELDNPVEIECYPASDLYDVVLTLTSTGATITLEARDDLNCEPICFSYIKAGPFHCQRANEFRLSKFAGIAGLQLPMCLCIAPEYSADFDPIPDCSLDCGEYELSDTSCEVLSFSADNSVTIPGDASVQVKVFMEAYGAGGGGGGSGGAQSNSTAGGGGGAWAVNCVTLAGGTVLDVTVGQGGAGGDGGLSSNCTFGTGQKSGFPGTSSTVVIRGGATLLEAGGGTGGGSNCGGSGSHGFGGGILTGCAGTGEGGCSRGRHWCADPSCVDIKCPDTFSGCANNRGGGDAGGPEGGLGGLDGGAQCGCTGLTCPGGCDGGAGFFPGGGGGGGICIPDVNAPGGSGGDGAGGLVRIFAVEFSCAPPAESGDCTPCGESEPEPEE